MNYLVYDLILTDGLEYVINSTNLLNQKAKSILVKKLKGEELFNKIIKYIKSSSNIDYLDNESYQHIAAGILFGYPDKVIIGVAKVWNDSDPFVGPFIDANIRGSKYYNCPEPVYHYPRHLVFDQQINKHEQLWSKILKDFYKSKFHRQLSANKDFKNKLKQLGLVYQ